MIYQIYSVKTMEANSIKKSWTAASNLMKYRWSNVEFEYGQCSYICPQHLVYEYCLNRLTNISFAYQQ